jgi:hypothetical protein
MKRLQSLIIFLFVGTYIFSQVQPQISFTLNVTDGRTYSKYLNFGVDPLATDGIDTVFGENFLPPFPPLGVPEVQIYLPENNFSGTLASYSDYRNGTSPYSGVVEHLIRYQKGDGIDYGDSVVIYWDLPQQITGILQDIITGTLINIQISGSGNFMVPNPAALDRLKLLITYNNATEVYDEQLHPVDFSLSQNYPNPFNPSTKIKYSIGNNLNVQLKIFDVLGKEITTLVSSEQPAGTYEVDFDGKELTSGIYFYTIKAGNYVETKSMILMK